MRRGWPLLLLAGCSGQPAITPGKIVSNNPCVDAILAKIAAPSQIGAVSAWSHDARSASAPLAWTRQFPGIGAEAEAIIAARPSLALTGAFGTTTALDKAGVQQIRFGVSSSVADSVAQVRTVASAIGRVEPGERLASAIEAAASPQRRSQPGATQKSAIIWLSGGFVPGKGTLQDELLARAGYRNASATYGLTQWDVLPLEALIRNPPDVIFSPAGGLGDAARSLDLRHRVLEKLTPRPRIVMFPERLLNCGGPSIVEVMPILRRGDGA